MSTDSKNETAERKLDLRGLVCPEPVLRTKKLLDDASVSKVEATVDGEINVNNLSRLARSLKLQFSSAAKDDNFVVTLERSSSAPGTDAKSGADALSAHTHAHSAPSTSKAPQAGTPAVGEVVFLGKDKFGDGDAEFSTTLINLFLQTMFESGQRPRAILMANTGVRLMAPDSAALKVLNDFRDAGVEVLACGLCVEFYGLKGKIPIEQITNMFAICEFMFAADKVIAP